LLIGVGFELKVTVFYIDYYGVLAGGRKFEGFTTLKEKNNILEKSNGGSCPLAGQTRLKYLQNIH
jgi:hypothetical protein